MKRTFLSILVIGILFLSACGASTTVPEAEAPSAMSPVPEPSLESAKTEFESFLTYMKFNQWDKMWSMLHPDIQAVYGNMEEFVKNMELRPNLKGFDIGSIQVIPQWTCRSTEDLIGTENTYSNVVEIPTTFIYTTVFGETEMSQMLYTVAVEKEWKFFIRRIKSTEPTPTVLTESEIIEISAAQLYAEYEVNELAANAQYEGKILEVTGVVESISRDVQGTPFVVLAGESGLALGVKCEFSSEDEPQLARLSKGDEITIRGKCVGYWIINVLLRECSLVD